MSYSYCFSSELWMRFLFGFTGIRSCWICFMKKQDIIFWKADTHVKYHIISCWEAFKLELNWVHIILKFTPFSFLGILSCNYFGYLCAYVRRLTSCSDHPAVYSIQFGTVIHLFQFFLMRANVFSQTVVMLKRRNVCRWSTLTPLLSYCP